MPITSGTSRPARPGRPTRPSEETPPESYRSPNRPWSRDDVSRLMQLWNTDHTNAEIAEILGRKETAIAVKATRINMGSKKAKGESTSEKRPCLRCRQPFMSAGRHNRYCDSCKSSPEWMSGNDSYSIVGGS